MKTRAAILVETGKPLVEAELDIPALKPGQVLVEIAYSGICHTQISEARGRRGPDRFLPHCLGHEATGTVLETGAEVTRAAAGDRVVLSWVRGGGIDAGGCTYEWGGRTVNAGGVTTFQRHAVVSENRVSKIPGGLDARAAVLLGCAVPTAAGAVLNSARAEAGQSVAVFGVGGIGLCAVAAAAAAKCAPVIAIDLVAAKLDKAKALGATHVIDAGAGDPVDAVKKICADGVDIAIEATGNVEVMAQALAAARNFGGTAVVIGNPPHGAELRLDPWQIIMGKRLVGAWSGGDDLDRDFPRFAELVASGAVDADVILSESYALADINAALDDLEAGRVARPLIDMTL